jgi:hypothetical protein
MANSKSEASAPAWQLARRQHGVVARRAVGRRELDRKGRWTAAVLSCGDGAVLSHRSAAAIYGIGEERSGVVEVSIRRRCEHHRPGIKVRSRPSLPSKDVGTHGGVPVTSPVRTLIDLATELPPRGLERAVNEADKRGVIDPETLRSSLDDYAGQTTAPPPPRPWMPAATRSTPPPASRHSASPTTRSSTNPHTSGASSRALAAGSNLPLNRPCGSRARL